MVTEHESPSRPFVKYVVACFAGRRRSDTFSLRSNPVRFVRAHLRFLRDFGPLSGINEAVFVVNGDGLKPEMFSIEGNTVPVVVNYRENIGFSYGAWQSVIEHDLKHSTAPDFYFLIEDDYVPIVPSFLEDFLAKCDPGTGYVAQLLLPTDSSHIQLIRTDVQGIGHVPSTHAAISNGLLRASAAQRALGRFGEVFSAANADNYLHAEFSQILFLSHLDRLGYGIADVSDTQLAVYANAENVHVAFGTDDLPVKIAPYGRGSFPVTHALLRRVLPRWRRLRGRPQYLQ